MSESQTETAASTPLVSSIEDIPAELVERIKARILAEVTTELRDSNNETESNFSASESDEAIKESNEHNYLELINESERIENQDSDLSPSSMGYHTITPSFIDVNNPADYEVVEDFDSFAIWSEHQNRKLLSLFNDLPVYEPDNGEIVVEWISAFNRFFESYSGIKKSVLGRETFNFESEKVKDIPSTGYWLKKCIDSLDERIVRFLQSKKVSEYPICNLENDIRLSKIWNWLHHTRVNFSRVFTSRLSTIAGFIYGPGYKNRFNDENRKFMTHSFDPINKFLIKLDHVTIGMKYYFAVKESVGDVLCLVLNKHFQIWLANDYLGTPSLDEILQEFREHPSYEPKLISQREAVNSVFAIVKSDRSKKQIRAGRLRTVNSSGTQLGSHHISLGATLSRRRYAGKSLRSSRWNRRGRI